MKLERFRFSMIIVALALVLVLGFATMGLTYTQFGWSSLAFAQDASVYTGGGEAGCNIEIPEGSVVGAFVVDTPLFWEPTANGTSTVSVGHSAEEAKTAWVVGQDSTESYYKIIWSCQYVWVPKSTMGPNYDALWQGRALPTRIIE